MPRDAGGRGITIMEPDLLAGRKLTKVQALQSWSWLQLSASLLVGCRLGTCPISPSWALLLFPFGNVAAEGPRPAEKLLRTVASFLPVDKWSLSLHLAKSRKTN